MDTDRDHEPTSRDVGRQLYRNPLSYVGFAVMAASAGLILFTVLLQYSLRDPSPYLGIFTYLVLPVGVGAGLVLVLDGMRRESLRRRRLRTTAARPYPRLDLNDRRQRRWFLAVTGVGSLLAILLVFVGYNGFLFTESVTFCGEVCHTVMEPEHTAYLASPHARVACVDCHVGHGATWYVKSKLSGARQVLAVLFDTYERPIPVPVKDLRPARETCEECHWPEKFYGTRFVQYPHFRYDEGNTAEQVSLVVKTGGGSPRFGAAAEGIHSAMIINNDVFFRAADEKLQDIVQVRVRSRIDGSERVYVSKDAGLDAAAIAALPERRMDCMDCHNRPTHIYPAPDVSVDRAMASELISPDLPWVKKVAVDALTRDYPDRDSARAGIRQEVVGYYQERYPEVARTAAEAIDRAVQALITIRDHSVFPAMNVDWKTYAMNNGHRNWPGCFRCHDGRHVLACESGCEETPIPRDCTTCHTAPTRGPLTRLGASPPPSDQDWHRWKLEGRHAEVRCDRCHQAGFRPPLACAECHRLDRKAPMMADMACTDCHQTPGIARPVEDCASCHDDLKGLHGAKTHSETPCITCHKPHLWTVEAPEPCSTCHKDRGIPGPDGGGPDWAGKWK